VELPNGRSSSPTPLQYSDLATALHDTCATVLGTGSTPSRTSWESAHPATIDAWHRRLLLARLQGRKTYRREAARIRKRRKRMATAWAQSFADRLSDIAKNPRDAWAAMRELRGGLMPLGAQARTVTLLTPDGQPIPTVEARATRWMEYFNELLNRPTGVQADLLAEHHTAVAPTRARVSHFFSANPHLAETPSTEEIKKQLHRMANHKAGGLDGIVKEMMVVGGDVFLAELARIVRSVWSGDQPMPQEWRDGVIVPLPKKGDLRQCGNYRGITLLAVAGKLIAKVLAARFDELLTLICDESQDGFRSNRSTMDAVFVLRRLSELAQESGTQLFALFIDLEKAYDSVDRPAMWQLLRNYGIPDAMVRFVESLHLNTRATVRSEGTLSPWFEVRNGLKQGCCLAPALFNVFFQSAIDLFRERTGTAGLPVLLSTNSDRFPSAKMRARRTGIGCTPVSEKV